MERDHVEKTVKHQRGSERSDRRQCGASKKLCDRAAIHQNKQGETSTALKTLIGHAYLTFSMEYYA